MRSIHRLAGAGALALASSLAFAVNAEAAASLVRPGAPGHGHMDHMAHGFAPGREDHRRFLEPRVIGGFYAGAAYGAALGAAAPYDYASPDYGYSTGYDTTEAAPATGGYAAPAYSNAPQAYSYAPQTYSHSYSVPTVVYQTVTRDYTIPVQTYRT
ncbi:MAG TPA: hypothetical protein VKS78_14740, partial [Roseiarcus sp.]|nr:hypothetical protein [Roseiarcus sp.]